MKSMNLFRRKNKQSVVVNGKTIEIPGNGNSVSIINNRLYVNGRLYEEQPEDNEKNLTVIINGDMGNLIVEKVDYANVLVSGNAGMVKTTSGDVTVDMNVSGSVGTTSGDIRIAGDVKEYVTTVSGDVSVRNIYGHCTTTSGDIR